MASRVCRRCKAGRHRDCVDRQPGPNLCECANAIHENHYDADGQLILVVD